MARRQETNKGNIPMDDGFIEWMQENEGLKVIDPGKEGLPFAAKLKWKGDRDSDDSPWKIPPPGKRCSGQAYVRDVDGDYIVDKNNERIMRPCWRWPMRGAKVCLVHGGGIERVKRSAVERLASSLDALTGALIRIGLDPDTPPKDRISAINSAMDRCGIKAGIAIDIQTPGYVDVLKDLFTRTVPGASSDD